MFKLIHFFSFTLGLTLLCINSASAVEFEKVAIMVFSQTDGAKRFERHAMNHLETILFENNITVLDKDKAEDLKNGWSQLEDPTALLTAEDFLENAEQYAIDGIVRIYLSLEVIPSLAETYTATAQADLRYVNETAQSVSYVTTPMGIKGNPPSDGLTQNAAGLNAIYRAVENAALKMKLEVLGQTTPRAIKLKTTPVKVIPKFTQISGKQKTKKHDSIIKLFDTTWKWEKISCASESPNGNLVAAAGFVTDGGMGRRYWYSRMHIVDVTNNNVPYVFDTWPKGTKPKRLRGSSKILDCMFLNSWRYAAAITGNYLFLWDTERGIELSKQALDLEMGKNDEPTLSLAKFENKTFIQVVFKNEKRVFKLEVDK